MTTVDTSSYPTDPNQGMNRLTSMMQFQSGVNKNKLLQMDIEGQQGLANLYSAAPKDASGMPDPNYIMSNAAAAGIHAQDAIQGAQQIQSQKVAIQRQLLGLSDDQLNLGKKVNDAIVSTTTPMLKDIQDDMKNGTYDKDAMQSKMWDGLTTLMNNSTGPDGKPVINAAKAVETMKSLNFDDPKILAQKLKQRAAQAQYFDGHISDALALKRGALGSADIGGMTQPTTQDLISGQVSPAGQPVPTGTSFQGGKTVYNSDIVPPDNQFSSQNSQAPDSQSSGIQLGDNPDNINKAAMSVAQRALPSPPPGAMLGYEDNAHQAQSLQRAAATIPQQKSILQQMSANLGNFRSGPGAQSWRDIAAGLNRIGIPVDTKGVSSQEEFNKLAGMIAQQQFQQLGGTGTDEKLNSAMSTSPNGYLSSMGNKKIIALLKGNADAVQAMNSEWKNSGLQPQDFDKFQQQFNKEYNPTVFQLQYMTPTERKEITSGMSDTEKKQFIKAGQNALDKGWIPDPRGK